MSILFARRTLLFALILTLVVGAAGQAFARSRIQYDVAETAATAGDPGDGVLSPSYTADSNGNPLGAPISTTTVPVVSPAPVVSVRQPAPVWVRATPWPVIGWAEFMMWRQLPSFFSIQSGRWSNAR